MFFFVDKTRHIMLEYRYTIKKHGGSKNGIIWKDI